jgi:hypothetical protein
MNDLRQTIGWLLLVMVAVVAGGAAVLGVSQAPKSVPLKEAVSNTLDATNYSEVVNESTAQGKQTDYLVYQAPDRLGGYIQSGNKRTYVYVIGTEEYQSLTVAANGSTKHLVFYRQPSEGAAVLDPAHNYLRYADQATHVKQSGSTYTFDLTQAGQTGTFVFTVSGQYTSGVSLTVKSASVQLVISQVGTSPPVVLPAGSKVVTAPTGSAPTGSASSSG